MRGQNSTAASNALNADHKIWKNIWKAPIQAKDAFLTGFCHLIAYKLKETNDS
jgi:hypothetical protein